MKIKAGKLRGQTSDGMLCSSSELGMGEGADGLLILPEDAVPGAPLSSVFPSDALLDVDITANRADLQSVIGIAREVAAWTGAPLKLPAALTGPADADMTAEGDGLEEVDASGCPHYTLRRVSGVKVGESPEWLKQRLQSGGIRPINNVVDVTNYVLLETGQPLHAFDAAKVSGKISVRPAAEGGKFLALDGETYVLRARDYVIADEAKTLVVAGIMGGEDSGVTESTTDLLLEAARFDPASVRQTSRELGLASDSSYRFERGVDPAGVLRASRRAAQLLEEVAGARDVGPIQQLGNGSSADGKPIALRQARLEKLAGITFTQEKIAEFLTRLGLTPVGDQVAEESEPVSYWHAPSYRLDLTREVDLIEEVIRMHGLGNIPARRTGIFSASSKVDRAYDATLEITQALVGLGFVEVRTYSLISAEELADSPAAAPEENRVRNPMTEEHALLRPSLLPGLLPVLHRNANFGAERQLIFELGRVYRKPARIAENFLAVALTGPRRSVDWRKETAGALDLHDLRGLLETALKTPLTLEPTEPKAPFALAVDVKGPTGKVLGTAGILRPARARQLDLRDGAVLAELNLDAFLKGASGKSGVVVMELAKFPAVTRDVALLAPADLAQEKIERVLFGAKEKLLKEVRLFDIFSGDKLAADKKSLAYTLTYRAEDRTLETGEVNRVHEKLVAALLRSLPVEVR
jgi:phenylalanyl-tRNA synthetase beta chain